MAIFKAPIDGVAYFKGGFYGVNGTGKSVTSALLAIGLIRKLGGGKVAYFDTEGGFGYVSSLFALAKVPVESAATQSFRDLAAGIREASEPKSGFKVLVVDSITHPWRTLVNGFKESKGIKGRSLPIYAWDILKTEWREGWALPYVNSPLHIIMCGRSANVFEDIEDKREGERKSIVVGTKMATEGETGYEPSLLVELTKELRIEDERGRATDKESPGQYLRRAFVVKDRFMEIDGLSAEFETPRTKDGKPDLLRLIAENAPMAFFGRHVDRLNLGGGHTGISHGSSTAQMFDDPAGDAVYRLREQRDLRLEEVKELVSKHFPGSTTSDKMAKGALIEAAFGTRVWGKIEHLHLEPVSDGLRKLQVLLEKCPRELLDSALGAGVDERGKLVAPNAAVEDLRKILAADAVPATSDPDADLDEALGKAPTLDLGIDRAQLPLDPEPSKAQQAAAR